MPIDPKFARFYKNRSVAPAPVVSDIRALMRARAEARPQLPVFQPSEQQTAFFDWIERGKGNALLNAKAGAGKSTTLIRATALMKGSIFLGAYNKDAVIDLKAKAQETGLARPELFIATCHGYGYTNWRRTHKNVELVDNKVQRLIKDLAQESADIRIDLQRSSVFVSKMVSFGKQFLIGADDHPAIENVNVWRKLVTHFSADQDLPPEVEVDAALEWVQEISRRSAGACEHTIDFDDMLYAPIKFNTRLFPNDWALLDEAQDANRARRVMIRRMMKHTSRAVFCGDRWQAIYGFTGAGGDSIDRIIEEFDCAELPLSVSYRCARSVVAYAQQWVPDIEAAPTAPEGIVRPVVAQEADAPKTPWFLREAAAPEDAVLCRYTRPLVTTAYAMLRAGVACKIAGRDVGKNLINLARMWRIKSLDKLDERLDTWLDNEIAKAAKLDSEKRRQEAEDRVATLRIFMARTREKGVHTIDGLVEEIESLFADKAEGVLTLCTGHKAKGREWKRVFWIRAAQRRPPQQEWEAQEESNINYVIATRAKFEMVFVPEKEE